MSFELLFTSAQRGLKPGTRGFCTVAVTEGVPQPMIDRLESLSGYRPVIQASDPGADRNPVNHAHYRLNVAGRSWSVLSRVAFAGLDYTQRSNKFAHHLVLESSELAKAGPAWLLTQPGVMQSQYEGEPQLLPRGKRLPAGDQSAGVCNGWARLTGDAGWAGVLADTLMSDPSKVIYLIVPLGTDMLPLINEAVALVPAAMRWQATFSTYYTDLPGDVQCAWRCVVAGTPVASQVQRGSGNALILDLTQPKPLEQSGGLIDAARTGVVTAAASAPVAAAIGFADADPVDPGPLAPRPRGRFSRATARTTGNTELYELEDPGLPSVDPTLPLPRPRFDPDHTPPRRHHSPILWAAAILWPVAVGVVLWFSFDPGVHPTVEAASVLPSGEPAHPRIKELTERIAAADDQLKKLETHRNTEANEAKVVASRLAWFDEDWKRQYATLATKERTISSLNKELKTLQNNAASQPLTEPQNANGKVEEGVPVPGHVHQDGIVVALLRQEGMNYRVTGHASGDPAEWSLVLPNNEATQETADRTWRSSLMQNGRQLQHGKFGAAAVPWTLLDVKISADGTITGNGDWSKIPEGDQKKNAEIVLRLSALRSESGVIQFVEQIEQKWSLEGEALSLKQLGLNEQHRGFLRLSMPTSLQPVDWHVTLEQDRSLVFRPSPERAPEFRIQLKPDGSAITSDWRLRYGAVRDEIAGIKANQQRYLQMLKDGLEGELRRLEKSLEDKEKPKRERDAIEAQVKELKQRIAETAAGPIVEAEKRISDLSALLRRMEQLKYCQLRVVLPNGVVLAVVRLEVPGEQKAEGK